MHLSENGRFIEELLILLLAQEGAVENNAQQRILYFRSGKVVYVAGKSPV